MLDQVSGRPLFRQVDTFVVVSQLDFVWKMKPFDPNNPLSSEVLEEEARCFLDAAQPGGYFGLSPRTRWPLSLCRPHYEWHTEGP